VAKGIDVCHELVAISDRAAELDLQIAAGIPDSYPVILDKSREQVDPLLKHLIPGFALGVLQRRVLVLRPSLEKRATRVFAAEQRSQCLFEGTTEQQPGPGFFLLPAVQVTIAVPERAGEILGELGVAVGRRRQILQLAHNRRLPASNSAEARVRQNYGMATHWGGQALTSSETDWSRTPKPELARKRQQRCGGRLPPPERGLSIRETIAKAHVRTVVAHRTRSSADGRVRGHNR